MTIYQRIKELAKLHSISIRELESELAFSNGTINKWKTRANTQKLQKVADFFNVSVDYLLGNDLNTMASEKTTVDLNDEDNYYTFDGKPVSKEDMELFKRLMRGK